jgi:hypothetical protein
MLIKLMHEAATKSERGFLTEHIIVFVLSLILFTPWSSGRHTNGSRRAELNEVFMSAEIKIVDLCDNDVSLSKGALPFGYNEN